MGKPVGERHSVYAGLPRCLLWGICQPNASLSSPLTFLTNTPPPELLVSRRCVLAAATTVWFKLGR